MTCCDTKFSRSRLKITIAIIAAYLCWLINPSVLCGQVDSRQEEIEQQRRDKKAQLHPERTSAVTGLFDRFIDLGLIEETGYNPIKRRSGPKLKLGGMRSGSGQTLGIGYRYSDLWRRRVNFEASARGTWRKAYMFDFEIGFPSLHKGRGQFALYTKYENSPAMDYYGAGPDSDLNDRTSYRFEDFAIDLAGRYRLKKDLYIGGFFGWYFPNIGRGQRSGFPSIEDKFAPEDAPGLGTQADHLRTGISLQYDSRDLPEGAKAGSHYYAKYSHYWDRTLGRHDFNYLNTAVEQYIPYRNKTRVFAFRLDARMSWTREGQTVPFYLQPTLGGSHFLRGFERYRFRDQNAIMLAIEHRWHLYSGGFAALFFETGKVAPKPSELNFKNLEYSGGIGFRFTIRDEVVIRIDNAVSREGYRIIWTFSDLW
jgi:outer membrane protein assembly factor BamA